jgi:hypothetical protein
VDTSAQQELTRELASGERLLWAGKPRAGVQLQAADALIIPFSLFWAGFAVFWEVSVVRSGAPLFFALWGVPFLLMGAYITVGRFFLDAFRRSRTYYGLTPERVLIVSGLMNREIKTLPLKSLPELTLSERADRSGTITFGTWGPFQAWMGAWPGWGAQRASRLELIDDVRAVYAKIREAQTA